MPSAVDPPMIGEPASMATAVGQARRRRRAGDRRDEAEPAGSLGEAAPGSYPRTMHRWAAAVGSLLTLVILWDAFQTIILSRRVSRRFRPTRAFYRLLWTPWRAAAKRFPQGNRRENVLTVFGPLSLILLIALWALGLIVSFALLHWGLGSRLTDPDGHTGFGVD